LKDQLKSLSKTTGVPETDFYEIQYFPPEDGVPLPASGHVVIRRLHSEASTQGRIRGLLSAVTVEDIGENGVISMRVDPPSAFMGSDALNVALVRNNGLTLDPDIAKQLAESETGGPDLTFLPGTWVTFGKKGTNVGTAQAKNVDASTVHTPTIRFKGKDGNIIGLNALEMEQVIGDPVARILFKRTAEALGGTMDANYIRFEDNRGAIVGLEHIYRRDGADGRSGNDLALAIWAQTALGGDLVILNAGDTVNGETANQSGIIRFGLGETARIYLAGPGDLRIEADNAVRVTAPATTIDGDLSVTGTSDLSGAVTMRNGLDMSDTDIDNIRNLTVGGVSDLSGKVAMYNGLDMNNTDINNIRNLTAAKAILTALTLDGKTGSQSSPYDTWVTNAATASVANDLSSSLWKRVEDSIEEKIGGQGYSASATDSGLSGNIVSISAVIPAYGIYIVHGYAFSSLAGYITLEATNTEGREEKLYYIENTAPHLTTNMTATALGHNSNPYPATLRMHLILNHTDTSYTIETKTTATIKVNVL
jgi:hypothetical protein